MSSSSPACSFSAELCLGFELRELLRVPGFDFPEQDLVLEEVEVRVFALLLGDEVVIGES